ncbi:MAG: helix-turn-helix domain-containing protein [Methyloceanibacter sp.]|nr:helix-turn-helix domain-containing protein [Methyloceanibacter sp.]
MDVFCKNFTNIECQVDTPHFSASISAAPLAESSLLILDSSGLAARRGPRQISQSTDDKVVVCMQLGGTILGASDDNEGALHPGDIWVVDLARPTTHWHRTTASQSCKALIWNVPRRLFEGKLGPIAALTHRKLRADSLPGRLLGHMLKGLPGQSEGFDHGSAQQAESLLADLLTVAYLGDDASSAVTKSYAPLAARFRLKSTIEMYLFDSRLKPSDFAEKAGIGTRHANTILAADGTSLERYIFERRLERSRAVLDNPAFDFRQVSEIAYSHGFASLSHFSRKFKEAFGMTPSEYRARRPQSHRAA